MPQVTAKAAHPVAGISTPSEISRYDLNERLVHWTTAALLLVLIVTGTILYIPSFMLAVGHRATIVNIHVISGLALVAPLVIGLVGPWRKPLADDLRRLDRWQRADFAFFGRRIARPVRPGKFNGGQKLVAALFGGGMAVMIATGIVMRWSPPFPNRWASGATLVHDTIYLVLLILVVGHVILALSRPVQLRSMFSGRVPVAWARRHNPAWLDGSDLRPAARTNHRAAIPPPSSAHRGPEAEVGTTRVSD